MGSRPPWLAGLVAAALVMAVGGLLVVLIPEVLGAWLYPRGEYPPDARTAWIDSLRTGVLGVLALGSVAAWVIQYRQAMVARTVDEYNDRVRQLSQDVWEQVAAIRDLVQIAKRSDDELRTKTLQMLAVFVRESAPRTEALSAVSIAEYDKNGPGGKRRPEPGVQEALRAIGSHLPEWAPQPEWTKEDVEDAREDAQDFEPVEGQTAAPLAVAPQDHYVSLADVAIDGAVLRGARLRGLNLRRTVMCDVKLERADLSSAKLRGAVLADADLECAILADSSLARAILTRADLREADLRKADLHKADLREADLHKADLRKADLRKADLRKADLRDAQLDQAKVEGAHLWGAVGLWIRGGQAIGEPHCKPGDPECRE